MMMVKRIIPCLDVKDGRVVKGVNFENLRDAGDPAQLAVLYENEGADELVFLDISATTEGRKTMVEVVAKTASQISIPLTVGGGISTVEDIRNILAAGAKKVSINSAAVKNPGLINAAAKEFGSESIVIAIDAAKKGETYEVLVSGGKVIANLDVINWAMEVEERGAGEILLTSMDKDGTKDGYDLDLTAAVSEAVKIPVIASGGAGNLEDLYQGIAIGKADGVLGASIFHFREYSIKEAKHYLKEKGVAVKL